MNLLAELHGNRIANPFLVSPLPLSLTDTDLQDIDSKAVTNLSLGLNPTLYTNKEFFVSNCFHCQLQDRIVCLLPNIQGFKHNVAVSGLIKTVLEPFSVSNNDKCFVFKVLSIM